MRKIVILDPSVGTENVGDEIIYDAVRTELNRLFPEAFFIRVSTHEFMLWETRRIIHGADHIFAGGSNLLKSRMEWNIQWKLSPIDYFRLKDVILLACGWRHYDGTPTPYTKSLYNRVLSKRYNHSVRDSMALSKLQSTGMSNVVNTACVTMWQLSSSHCAQIPTSKSIDAVVTVTAYNPNEQADRLFLTTVIEQYRNTYLFVQQPDDLDYAQRLAEGRLIPIAPTLNEFDKLLATEIDYIGTRLHGGIRAMQKMKRTTIISIDNRATEIAKDTNIPVIERNDVQMLSAWINGAADTRIKLPQTDIDSWRRQFESVQDL